MAAKIKKGDTVKILSGNDKQTTGEVLRVDVSSDRVLVKGINMCWKHVKPSKKNPQGGRLQVERPIHVSNVIPLVGDATSRVKFKTDGKGNKKRVLTNGTQLDK